MNNRETMEDYRRQELERYCNAGVGTDEEKRELRELQEKLELREYEDIARNPLHPDEIKNFCWRRVNELRKKLSERPVNQVVDTSRIIQQEDLDLVESVLIDNRYNVNDELESSAVLTVHIPKKFSHAEFINVAQALGWKNTKFTYVAMTEGDVRYYFERLRKKRAVDIFKIGDKVMCTKTVTHDGFVLFMEGYTYRVISVESNGINVQHVWVIPAPTFFRDREASLRCDKTRFWEDHFKTKVEESKTPKQTSTVESAVIYDAVKILRVEADKCVTDVNNSNFDRGMLRGIELAIDFLETGQLPKDYAERVTGLKREKSKTPPQCSSSKSENSFVSCVKNIVKEVLDKSPV